MWGDRVEGRDKHRNRIEKLQQIFQREIKRNWNDITSIILVASCFELLRNSKSHHHLYEVPEEAAHHLSTKHAEYIFVRLIIKHSAITCCNCVSALSMLKLCRVQRGIKKWMARWVLLWSVMNFRLPMLSLLKPTCEEDTGSVTIRLFVFMNEAAWRENRCDHMKALLRE